jgi:hypothetical protein
MLPTREMLETNSGSSLFIRNVSSVAISAGGIEILFESLRNISALTDIVLIWTKKPKSQSFKTTEPLRVQECEQTDVQNLENLQFVVGGLSKHFFNFFEHHFSLGTFQFKFEKENSMPNVPFP